MENYKLHQSKLIQNNYQNFIVQCSTVSNIIKNKLNTTDTTWNYYRYNLFSVTSSSILFYELYKELNYHIRSFVGDDRPLWIQSWLNYHKGDEVEKKLHPHSHEWDYHGYISIDPQDTTTIFHKGYEIQNKIGQIYLGLGNGQENQRPELTHYVKINKPYTGTRITIGFDLATSPNNFLNEMTFIPLL
jgi:hypothetical protein